MFELDPFCTCPTCHAVSSFGVLNIGNNTLMRRCKACRYTENETLPTLDKRVVYLDQFAISNIYKVRSGEKLRPAHIHNLWVDFDQKITRAHMLQGVIFPPSDIHRDETIVSRFPSELRIAHEMFGGDTSFRRSGDLQMRQQIAFAEAFEAGQSAPDLGFKVDEAITGKRNGWLSRLHITVNSDYSSFAGDLRRKRSQTHAELSKLFESWKVERPGFKDILKKELAAYGLTNRQMAADNLRNLIEAQLDENFEKAYDIAHSNGMRELFIVRDFFKRKGYGENDSLNRSSLFKKQQTTDKKLQFEVRIWPYCLHRDPQKVEGPALDRGWPCHHGQRQGRCHRGDDGV